jgi:hypothetical protein
MRQAVVVIHGIGEQRPMSTLRSFVENVLRVADLSPTPMFSKPDRMSESFELRRLVAEKTRSRPMTDFYEYYWAYHMEGTKLRHLWPWVRTILLRSPSQVPAGLRVIWAASWVLALAAVAAFVTSRVSSDTSITGPSWTALAFAGAFFVVQGFAIAWLGDAARYLSPLPRNIAVRHEIRTEGIRLLRQIHRSGHYDRIVLVGHSLGSVIGYDILTHLWSQLHAEHAKPDRLPQHALTRLQELGRQLSPASSPEEVATFREAQRALWIEQRSLGFPWLVTDFITLGSPLAHAALLLAKDETELTERQEQRELPRCPPVEDDRRYSYKETYQVAGRKSSIWVLHYAAPFAVTRWSNVYVPVHLGLLGDPVGGRLQPIFGPGILDVPVTEGAVRFAPFLSHTRYWRGPGPAKRAGHTTALGALNSLLALDSAKWSRQRGAPSPAAPMSAPVIERPADGAVPTGSSEATSK